MFAGDVEGLGQSIDMGVLKNHNSSNGSNSIRQLPSPDLALAAKFCHTFLDFPLIDEEEYVSDSEYGSGGSGGSNSGSSSSSASKSRNGGNDSKSNSSVDSEDLKSKVKFS